MAGKTGTAQWVVSEKKNLGWFAGFVPSVNPRFAFAAVYEGDPGERVGGGSKAAPIVHDVIARVYEDMEAAAKAEPGLYEELSPDYPKIDLGGSDLPVAQPVEAVPAQPVEPENKPRERRGFLQRLFR